jgi:hypothetical protein
MRAAQIESTNLDLLGQNRPSISIGNPAFSKVAKAIF